MKDVTVKRLGEVRSGPSGTQVRTTHVDPNPIVLWSGSRPVAALYHQVKVDSAAGAVEDSIERASIGSGGRGGPFPLTIHGTYSGNPKDADALDRFAVPWVVAADLDGDGTDELVAPHQAGSVEVLSLTGQPVRFHGASARPQAAAYWPAGLQVARLGRRAVVHLLQRRKAFGGVDETTLEEIGAGARYVLLRIDAKAVTRIVLGDLGWPVEQVLAVGALNRPGSSEVDELLVVATRQGGQEAFLSRHRPDGALLAPARALYLPFAAGRPWAFEFLPQSRSALLTSPGSGTSYFIEPEKPANWLHLVDLEKVAGGTSGFDLLGVVDAAAKPKALFLHGEVVWAFDADGVFYTVAGGAFAPVQAPAPAWRIGRPDGGLGTIGVFRSPLRGDEVLVAASRPAGARDLPPEELRAAAARFLDSGWLERERAIRAPSLTEYDPRRDAAMEAERRRRHLEQAIPTIEDWKRLLPDSYREMEQEAEAALLIAMKVALTSPLEDPALLKDGDYRDVEAFRHWLADQKVSAETRFQVVRRGAVVRTVTVPGELGPYAATDRGGPALDWRNDEAGFAVATTITSPEGHGAPQPGLYLVEAAGQVR